MNSNDELYLENLIEKIAKKHGLCEDYVANNLADFLKDLDT